MDLVHRSHTVAFVAMVRAR